MAEEKDDKQAGKTGSQDSSSGAVSGSDNGNEASSAVGTEKTVTKVPYHEDPELQDYISRQVEKRLEGIMGQFNVESKAQSKDEMSDIVDELTKEFNLDNTSAQKYAGIIKKIAERVSDKKLDEVKPDIKTSKLQIKISEFAQQHPDMFEIRDEMLNVLKRLPSEEQNFIKNSENGIEYLYNKVKIRKISSISQDNKNLGTSVSSSSGTQKVAGRTIVDRANEAFKKGDKATYNKLMQDYIVSQR